MVLFILLPERDISEVFRSFNVKICQRYETITCEWQRRFYNFMFEMNERFFDRSEMNLKIESDGLGVDRLCSEVFVLGWSSLNYWMNSTDIETKPTFIIKNIIMIVYLL
ncbi:hypothetical protein WA026_010549 [Henosepilachna vigintioctopunctata]|uniref:Uncharacterized protein n=1 Tax=Henosepilachna vigintioctopunctata TaxID=420089 RepID=A0AAW1VBU5_9CUCU